MKILKRIIIFLVVLTLLIAIGIIVLAVIIFDSSSLSYDPNSTHQSMEEVLGSEMVNSLDNIYNTSYNESDNEIIIGITDETLNNYLFENIRLIEGNSTYYDGSSEEKTYIMESNTIKLNTVEFMINDDMSLAVKLRGEAFGFYKSSIYLSANISIKTGEELISEGANCNDYSDSLHVLDIEFSEIKLGNTLKVTASWVKSLFKDFNLNFTEEIDFDLNRLAFYLNFDEVLENTCSDSFLLKILQTCDYEVSVDKKDTDTKAKLYLTVNTTNLFSEDVIYTVEESYANVITKISSSMGLGSITLTEDEFNALISDSLEDNLNSFNKNINFGNSTITMKLLNPYFDLRDTTLFGNFKFNNTNSVAKVETDISYDNINKNINVTINDVYAGNVSAGALTKEDGTTISNLSFSLDNMFGTTLAAFISNITFDSTNETVTITF